MGLSDTTARLNAVCSEAGFALESVDPSVAARLELLAEHTQTFSDSERMTAMARDVFRHYETTKPAAAFTAAERRIVVLGCLFSDIGKTGPARADVSGQRLIVEMFAVEGVEDVTQSVAQFLSRYFPADADERLLRFQSLELDPGMSIRAFWNLHSTWTLEIMDASGVPPEVIVAAATHHLLDDVNPGAIVAADQRYTRSFGDNPTFDRAEKLIIVLDKYDALRRRGRRTHEQAMAWLKERVEASARFRGDEEFSTLIADLDAAIHA